MYEAQLHLYPLNVSKGFVFQETWSFVSFLHWKCFKANSTAKDSPANYYFQLELFFLQSTWEEWRKKTHHILHLCNRREGQANAVHLFCSSGRVSFSSMLISCPSQHKRFLCPNTSSSAALSSENGENLSLTISYCPGSEARDAVSSHCWHSWHVWIAQAVYIYKPET